MVKNCTKVEKLHKTHKITQMQFAEKICVSNKTVSGGLRLVVNYAEASGVSGICGTSFKSC